MIKRSLLAGTLFTLVKVALFSVFALSYKVNAAEFRVNPKGYMHLDGEITFADTSEISSMIHSKNKFPKVQFHLESDQDTLWTQDYRESIDELEQRLDIMIKYLHGRSEKNIAIVGHSSYFGQFKDNHIGYKENGDEELKHCYPYEYILTPDYKRL